MNSKTFSQMLYQQIKNPAQRKDAASLQSRYNVDDPTWRAINSGNWEQTLQGVDCQSVLTDLVQQAFEPTFSATIDTRGKEKQATT